MQACVIMHNMIENDRQTRARYIGPYECQGPLVEVDHQVPAEFADFSARHAEIHDTTIHTQLQHDLVEHLWRLKGEASTASASCSSTTSICLIICCLQTFNF
jgi:hypothetical protein